MENTSYALHIAVGVLIAIGIISLIIFGWRKIGITEKSIDESVAVKNKADFNAEFEAYNKNLMYGTDVLSCLNKAQNNNQKYVYNNYYGTSSANVGIEDKAEYFIDVEVTINSTLYDEIKAYYRDAQGKFVRVTGITDDTNYKDKVFGNNVPKFDIPKIYYYYFKDGKIYQEETTYAQAMWNTNVLNYSLYNILTAKNNSGSVINSGLVGKIETNFKSGTYNLLTIREDNSIGSDKKESAQLSALITTVSLKSQELNNNPLPTTVLDNSDWYYCTWTTAASDFKKRKFKCEGTEYDPNTGYINKIKFIEF